MIPCTRIHTHTHIYTNKVNYKIALAVNVFNGEKLHDREDSISDIRDLVLTSLRGDTCSPLGRFRITTLHY